MPDLLDKKMPPFLGIVLVLFGLGVTIAVSQNALPFLSHAAPSEDPKELRITNISPTTFTITYKTPTSIPGVVSFGTTPKLTQTVIDDRDKPTNVPSSYTLHSITIQNLKPKTTYYYAILSGKTLYQDNKVPFTMTTPDTLSDEPTTPVLIEGKVVGANGKTPSEALIYVRVDQAQILSTIIKPGGLYTIPLTALRSESFDSFMKLTASSRIKLLITDGLSQSQAVLSKNTISPVPLITLSSDYDFVENTSSPAKSASDSAAFGFPSFSFDTTTQEAARIVSPKKDERFVDTQPLFKGNAPTAKSVDIIIHSAEEIKTTIPTDRQGNWSYRPNEPLSPGEHIISVFFKDRNGILKQMQQSFTVYAQGNQIETSATPSATLTPTTTNAPTSTPVPTATPTRATPSPTPVVTVIPTQAPTTPLQPSPTRPILAPTTPTGSEVVWYGIGIGTVFAGIGLLFFIL